MAKRNLFTRTVDAMTCRVQESPRETAARIRWLTTFRRPRLLISLLGIAVLAVAGLFCLTGTAPAEAPAPAAGPAAPAANAAAQAATPYSGQIGLLLVGLDKTAAESGAADGDVPDEARPVQADTIAYLRWDCDSGAIQILQLPGNLYVADGSLTANQRLCGIPAAAGVAALADRVSSDFDLPVDGYISLDLDGLAAIVDHIGGVEVTLPEAIDYRSAASDDTSYLPAGTHLLSGESVNFLVRARRGYANGDVTRQQVQQSFYAGLLRYARSCTPADAVKLMAVIAPYLETNLSLPTLTSLAASVETVEAADVTFVQLPLLEGRLETAITLQPQPDMTASLLNEYFRSGESVAADALGFDRLPAGAEISPAAGASVTTLESR